MAHLSLDREPQLHGRVETSQVRKPSKMGCKFGGVVARGGIKGVWDGTELLERGKDVVSRLTPQTRRQTFRLVLAVEKLRAFCHVHHLDPLPDRVCRRLLRARKLLKDHMQRLRRLPDDPICPPMQGKIHLVAKGNKKDSGNNYRLPDDRRDFVCVSENHGAEKSLVSF
ncbi:hypothetical protein DFH07DRAFT_793384 [Mycena maculata]|uniref:Uncharacterized protein n=1 Tax=Mycena maculata TaxID=230809 RepID=A0AAD7KDC3_9AGAR|nr:hypothetical protein DFH07DRAFT_793384 [Mycena maculata]